MSKSIKIKKKWLDKDFYHHENGNFLRKVLKKYDESKLSGYRYKTVNDGTKILIGIKKDKYIKKGDQKTVALSLLINKNVDINTLKGKTKKMMLKFKKAS